MNRPDISRLNKNRGIFLNIGFILALSLVIFAFNWTSELDVVKENPNYEVEDFKEIEMIRTPPEQKKKLPPPPVAESTPDPIIDDTEFIEDPIVETIDDPSLPEPVEPKQEPVTRPVPKPAPMPMPPAPKTFSPDEGIFMVVEEMPRFPGCEDAGMSKEELKLCADKKMLGFIYEHIKYPRLAVETGTKGVAVLQFVIEKDGSITDIKIARDPGAGLGNEAVRVVKTMPKWHPGKQRGVPVRVRYNLPVKYVLQ